MSKFRGVLLLSPALQIYQEEIIPQTPTEIAGQLVLHDRRMRISGYSIIMRKTTARNLKKIFSLLLSLQSLTKLNEQKWQVFSNNLLQMTFIWL